MPRLRSGNVRVYQSLRTAHLERAHQLPPAAFLYRRRRYDFDERLAEGLEVHRVTPLRAALLLARAPVEVLEVNEPLMRPSLPLSAAAVAAVRVRGLLSGRRTRVVSYAIVNLDPFDAERPDRPDRPGRLKRRLRRAGDRALARFVRSNLDRICYGTSDARDVYRRGRPVREVGVLIPALPAPVPVPDGVLRDRLQVVFLGGLLPRKGLERVLDAWPLIAGRVPGAHLLVLGKGPLEARVRAAAEAGPGIEFRPDPSRPVIQQELARSQVLVLPSQPHGEWREQVGLPIVEGLAAGCSVVTSTETGLARWLAEHGHSVIAPGADPEQLARAVVEQLHAARPGEQVIADLPAVDGRLEADAWLFRG